MRQYVTFHLRGQLFGLEILLVREINQIIECTQVQHAPPFILGLVNLRGQIVTIFDLCVRLGLASSQATDTTHNVVMKSNDELAVIGAREGRGDLRSSDDMVGLRVDAIGEVVELEEERIEPAPANIGQVSARFIAGVVALPGELLVLLRPEELLQREA
jgi:purine-binding chemotaxis protein CheW